MEEALGSRSCPFKMQSRCDLMTEPAVAALKRAGCAEVWMGCESGSQKILDAMDKGLRVEQVYKARENLAASTAFEPASFCGSAIPVKDGARLKKRFVWCSETAARTISASRFPIRFQELNFTRTFTRKNRTQGPNWIRRAPIWRWYFRGAYPSGVLSQALADALHLEVRGGSGPH